MQRSLFCLFWGEWGILRLRYHFTQNDKAEQRTSVILSVAHKGAVERIS